MKKMDIVCDTETGKMEIHCSGYVGDECVADLSLVSDLANALGVQFELQSSDKPRAEGVMEREHAAQKIKA